MGPPGDVAGASSVGGTASLLSIPDIVLAAYRNAARLAPTIASGCRMDWAVLAGIGRVESRHGMHFGTDSVIDTQGTVRKPIIGPALNGENGVSSIKDTDAGRWDGDAAWDHAVGPMQFIPSSWRLFGQDGNGDGVLDPHNTFDAALAAVAHLCGTAAADLRYDRNLDRALYGYNHSEEYVRIVGRWIEIYRSIDLSDVPRVAVRNQFPDPSFLSPFPAPHDRIAGIFASASPLASIRAAGTSGTTRATVVSATSRRSGTRAATGDHTTRRRRSSGTSDGNSEPSSPRPTPAPDPDPRPAPDPDPRPAPDPDPTPAPDPDPTPAPEPEPDPTPAPEPEPEPTPAPEPEPEPTPAPEPDPEPTPAPEPTPEPAPEPSSEPTADGGTDTPTADPVSYTLGSQPWVTDRSGAAQDWPLACGPLWDGVITAVRADATIMGGTAVAVLGEPERLAPTSPITWSRVWRVVTYGCDTWSI
jgi:hypothetical protein